MRLLSWNLNYTIHVRFRKARNKMVDLNEFISLQMITL